MFRLTKIFKLCLIYIKPSRSISYRISKDINLLPPFRTIDSSMSYLKTRVKFEAFFGVDPETAVIIHKILQLPEFKLPNSKGYISDNIERGNDVVTTFEALLICFARINSSDTFAKLAINFRRDRSKLGAIWNEVKIYVVENHFDRLFSLDSLENRFSGTAIQVAKAAFVEKFYEIARSHHFHDINFPNEWRDAALLVDGIRFGVGRPEVYGNILHNVQECSYSQYAGHNLICLVFTAFNGLVAAVVGAKSGNKTDVSLYNESNAAYYLENLSIKCFGDALFTNGDGIIALPKKNRIMISDVSENQAKVGGGLRVPVEWVIGDIKTNTYLDSSKKHKIFQNTPGITFKFIIIITQLKKAIHGTNQSLYYGIPTPSAESWFETGIFM